MTDGPASAQEHPSEPTGPGVSAHLFLLLCGGLVVAFLVWAWFGRLEVVSNASGEVIPSTQVKSVQHLEGGIVREIMTREGDRVEKGQPLISLEPTSRGADVGELAARLTALRSEVARLEGQASAADAPTFPEDLVRDHPDMVREARNLFDARRSRMEKDIAAQAEQVRQREQQIQEASSRLANNRRRLKLLGEQVKISEDLLKEDLTNRMLHLNLLKERAEIRGQVDQDETALPRLRAAVKEARLRADSVRDAFLEESRLDLEAKRRELEEVSRRMAKFEDTLQRTVVRSPVAGVVKTLHVHTVGGVIQPGGSVIDVVPEGDRLVVEAQLPVQDVGYIHPGQTATVKLASSDAIRFGDLEGKVVNVSPDAIEGEDGTPYFRVRIETVRDFFERKGLRYRLVPGVQVFCAIRTGERSVMEYLLEPFLGSFDTALRER